MPPCALHYHLSLSQEILLTEQTDIISSGPRVGSFRSPRRASCSSRASGGNIAAVAVGLPAVVPLVWCHLPKSLSECECRDLRKTAFGFLFSCFIPNFEAHHLGSAYEVALLVPDDLERLDKLSKKDNELYLEQPDTAFQFHNY